MMIPEASPDFVQANVGRPRLATPNKKKRVLEDGSEDESKKEDKDSKSANKRARQDTVSSKIFQHISCK